MSNEYKPIERYMKKDCVDLALYCYNNDVESLESKYKQAFADKEVLREALEWIASHKKLILTDKSAYAFSQRAEEALQSIEDKTKGGIE